MRDLIRELIEADPHAEPSTLAEQAIGRYRTRADLAQAVLHLVAEEVAGEQRHRVRRIEQESMAPRADRSDPMTVRTGLLGERFYTGDDDRGVAGYVTWGDATADDHRARVKYLQSMQTSIDATIEQAGATCLAEVNA